MTPKKLLSREEVLSGLRGRPIKRAHTALALIKNRTAQLAAQSQLPVGLPFAETTLKARNQAFLEALALESAADAPARQTTIQALERHAPQWASLAPVDPGLRATLANLLAQEYQFTRAATPQLRLALGLDSDAVQQAYQRLFDQPLTTIYQARTTSGERLRWVWSSVAARLEALPPFWLAFALTLPGASGLLALPIALAQANLITGLVLLVFFGLLNLLTVAAMAETVARSGTMRFGLGFLGQLTQEYLGSAGSLLMTAALALNNFLVLPIFFIGVGSTLADATGLPAMFWIAALFGVCLYFLSRQSLNATVATTLLIIFINIAALLLIPLLALPHFHRTNLVFGGLSGLGGSSLAPATWAVILGILLSTYFSHMQVATYGSVVLQRDPSARTWIRGSMAAILFYILIACGWLIVVNGVIPSAVLISTPGTVLEPLAAQVGPLIHLLGAWLVIFSMGLTAIQIALGLYYLTQERLPARAGHSWIGRLGERGRFWLAVSPVVVVFFLAEWIALTGFGTFTSLLSILGVLLLPLIAGIFPVLLLYATRRKGDFMPGVVYRFLGNPVLLAGLYCFFLAIILIHGLFLWQNLWARAAALMVVVGVIGATLVMLRRGAFRPRLVVEVRKESMAQGSFSAVAGGQFCPLTLHLNYLAGTQEVQAATGIIPRFATLETLKILLPTLPQELKNGELKIWVHQVTPEGNSVGVPAQLRIIQDGVQQTNSLPLVHGQITLPLTGQVQAVELYELGTLEG